MAGVIELRNIRAVEERMHRFIRNAGKIALLVVLILAVTGIWTCLWLPPF